MPTCRVCKRDFAYDDERGYSRDLCGPICDGVSMGLARRPIPAEAVCFFMDGNQWCCVNGDFANLQESPAGFGDTFDVALADLHVQIQRLKQGSFPCSQPST